MKIILPRPPYGFMCTTCGYNRGPAAQHICGGCDRFDCECSCDELAAEIDGAVVADEEFGGNTMAHYTPVAPRAPATPTPSPLAAAPLAEIFQEMLWRAYAAGAAGEPFEAWYAREVLRGG